MRQGLPLAALLCLGALGACKQPAAGPAAHISLPAVPLAPAPSGLWIQQVSDRHGTRTTRYCLDAASAQALADLDRKLGEACGQRGVDPTGDRSWVFHTDCQRGGLHVATQGVVRGDFPRRYTVDALSAGAASGRRSRFHPVHIVADISWQSDCPKDMQPGEVVWPDGRRSRLTALAPPA
jgi:hypothetical protein